MKFNFFAKKYNLTTDFTWFKLFSFSQDTY